MTVPSAPSPPSSGGTRAALATALLLLGAALGAAAGLLLRATGSGAPDAASPEGPSTAGPEARARAPVTAFLPVVRPPREDEPPDDAAPEPAAATTAPVAGSVGAVDAASGSTATAARAAREAVARLDGPLATSLSALLAAALPPPVPAGVTRGAITGVVRLADGAPLEGARIAALPDPPEDLASRFPIAEDPVLEVDMALVDVGKAAYALRLARDRSGAAVSGPDGAYAIEGLADDAYEVRATSPGRAVTGVSGSAEARPGGRVDLAARAARAVVVRVLGPDGGSPASADFLQLSATSGDTALMGHRYREGTFCFEAPVGPLEVRVVGRIGRVMHGGDASFDVGREGPTPLVTVRLSPATEGAAALSGIVTGLAPVAARVRGALRVVARPLAPGQAAGDVSPDSLLRSGTYGYADLDDESPRYEIDRLPPGRYAVAAVDDGSAGPIALVTISALGPEAQGVVQDVVAPPTRAVEGLLVTIRLVDPRGAPVVRRNVQLRRRGPEGRNDMASGETDDEGLARLRLSRAEASGADEAGGGALEVAVANVDQRRVYAVERGPDAAPGECTVVVRDEAVLVVAVSPERLDAIGSDATIAVTPRGTTPEDYDLHSDRHAAPVRDGRALLGPVASGPCDVWVTAGRTGGDHEAPLARFPIVLAPGVNELTLPPVAARGLTAAAPGPGRLFVFGGGGAGAPSRVFDLHLPDSGRVELTRLPAHAVVLAYIPSGRDAVGACALAPPGMTGEVVLSADQGRGLRVVVAERPSAWRGADGARLPLLPGDVVEAVDGAPIEDALRPFGDRLDPAAPEAPIRLTLRRGDRRVDVEVTPEALRRTIEVTDEPLFAPAPPAE